MTTDRTTRVFGIAPGRDFSADLVRGLRARLSDAPPEAMARVTIFTNTQRAARRLEVAFSATGPILLPHIRVIPDLANDPLLRETGPIAEPIIAVRLRLTQLVRRLLETDVGLAAPAAAFDLAGSLASLMDEMAGAGIALDAFEGLRVETASQHWQTALQFLRLMATAIGDADAATGPEARQRLAVAHLARQWAADPPGDMVIVAGSTGSRNPTAALMKAVLDLPQGMLVFPGFDHDLNARSWSVLQKDEADAADHPQFGFAALARSIKFDIADVSPWHDADAPNARAALLSLALRPAPVTDGWRIDGPPMAARIPQALSGLAVLEAPNEQAEAAAIAVALRAALDEGDTAALITPDGTLARRVTAQLDRWGILPDESAGQPLHLTPEGVFLGLLMTWCETPDPVSLAALLKHPLCASQGARGPHLLLARALDASALRDCGPIINWDRLQNWATAEGDAEARDWIDWLRSVLNQPPLPQTAPLRAHIARHRALAEALCADPKGAPPTQPNPFWTTEPGKSVDRILTDLEQANDAAGLLSQRDYRAVFDTLTQAEKKRPEGYAPDQRVLIWGQLEARVQSADLTILGGLNEGTWPAIPAPDPWLNRELRGKLGLSLPERRIGLAAHDFQQAASAPHVILSRALRQDNTPTVPSRWLVRLENLVTGLGDAPVVHWAAAKDRGGVHLARAAALDAPTQKIDPAPRPAPVVPLSARPKRIYVTHTEHLVRDPYAYYVRQILRLHELPRAGRSADPRDRGNALHLVLERFVRETMDGLPDDAEAAFSKALDWVMSNQVPWPAQRRLWHARLARLTADFVTAERGRRAMARPADLETKGAVPIPGFTRDLELAAKADRIDLTPDGAVAIYDYKSRIDTRKQIMAFAKQLPLEAKMASMGGFLDKAARIAVRLELIGLSKPGEAHAFTFDAEELDKIWREFLGLVAHYEDPAAAYPSRLRIMKERDAGDYDHLARRGEWADGVPFEPEPMA